MKLLHNLLVFLLVAGGIYLTFLWIPQLVGFGLSKDQIDLGKTLLGTLIGIILALMANHYYTAWKDKARLRSLYDACVDELTDYLESFIVMIKFTSVGFGTPPLPDDPPALIDDLGKNLDYYKYYSPTMVKWCRSLGSRRTEGILEMINHMRPECYAELKKRPKLKKSLLRAKIDLLAELDFQRRFIHHERLYLLGLASDKDVAEFASKFANKQSDQIKKIAKEAEGDDWVLMACDDDGTPVQKIAPLPEVESQLGLKEDQSNTSLSS